MSVTAAVAPTAPAAALPLATPPPPPLPPLPQQALASAGVRDVVLGGHHAPPTTLLPALSASRAADLASLRFAFVVADARARDYPIVHCSRGFTELTGYPPSEVLGRNCRFLQGPGTSRRKVAEIRDALREERGCHVCLLNYRRDGTPFWCLFHLAPVQEGGATALYIGVQTDVTALVEQARARRAGPAEAAGKAARGGEQEVKAGGGGGGGGAPEGEEDDEGDAEEQEARAAAESVVEEARAAAKGKVRRLVRALSRSALGAAPSGAAHAAAPPPAGASAADDTSDEEELAALSSLEEGEAVAVARALAPSRPASASASGCPAAGPPSSAAAAAAAAPAPPSPSFPAVPARLLSHLFRVQSAFVLSDPRRPDCPIVFASEPFLRMTGYGRDEVVGRNCRFLQRRPLPCGGEGEGGEGGEGGEAAGAAAVANGGGGGGGGANAASVAASAAELARLRAALAEDPPRPATVTLLNYRKDGSAFWNALHVAPVRGAGGGVEFYVGVQLDVTGSRGRPEAGTGAGAGLAALAREAVAGGGGGEGKAAAAGGEAAGAASAAGGGARAAAAPSASDADDADTDAPPGLVPPPPPPPPAPLSLQERMTHSSTTGAVRVACRALVGGDEGGLRRSADWTGLGRALPKRGWCSRHQQQQAQQQGQQQGQPQEQGQQHEQQQQEQRQQGGGGAAAAP